MIVCEFTLENALYMYSYVLEATGVYYQLTCGCCYLPTAYCPAGEELVSGKCAKCQRGFYKSNENKVARFDKCEACPVEHITEVVGATHVENCTIGKLLFLTGTLTLH